MVAGFISNFGAKDVLSVFREKGAGKKRIDANLHVNRRQEARAVG